MLSGKKMTSKFCAHPNHKMSHSYITSKEQSLDSNPSLSISKAWIIFIIELSLKECKYFFMVSLILILLAHSWFTILCWFSSTYTYIHSFRFFSLRGYHRILNRVHCAIECSLLVIYLIYSSVGMFTSSFWFIPPSHFPFGNHKFVSDLSVRLFLLCKQVHLYHFFLIPHVNDTV